MDKYIFFINNLLIYIIKYKIYFIFYNELLLYYFEFFFCREKISLNININNEITFYKLV